MAAVAISISKSQVFKEVARRTSVATETDPFYKQNTTEKKQYSQLHGEGDRITTDFLVEAAKEVLKAFLSRQGDLSGTDAPFEITATDVVYRFEEAEPVLPHSASIKQRLTDNVRDALVYYVMLSLYRTDGNVAKEKETFQKCLTIIDELSGDLYRLHD
ncbi:hypothetical protein [Draconibacterium sp.]|uniref:hypothetical protein n=1 Tax=Draconibacterium sp. TaxID=1965318 RepID=UPI003563592F